MIYIIHNEDDIFEYYQVDCNKEDIRDWVINHLDISKKWRYISVEHLLKVFSMSEYSDV